MHKNVVIVGYVRSPFHFAGKGELASVRADDLAALTVAELLKRTGIGANDIEDLILGCAFPRRGTGF